MHSHDPQSAFLVPLPTLQRVHNDDFAEYENLDVEGRFVGLKSGNAWLVRAVGEIDLDTAKKLERTIGGMLDADCLSVIVNVEDVSYIDSTGLGVLAKAGNRVRAKGKQLCLVSPSPQMRRVIFSAALGSLIGLFDNEERAFEAVNRALASSAREPS